MSEDLHEHEIDGLFRRGLEGAEDSPSPGLWSAIEEGLDAAPIPPSASAPASSGGWMHPLLLKGLAGIAILAVVGSVSYYLGRDSQRREQTNVLPNTSEVELQQATGKATSPYDPSEARTMPKATVPAQDIVKKAEIGHVDGAPSIRPAETTPAHTEETHSDIHPSSADNPSPASAKANTEGSARSPLTNKAKELKAPAIPSVSDGHNINIKSPSNPSRSQSKKYNNFPTQKIPGSNKPLVSIVPSQEVFPSSHIASEAVVATWNRPANKLSIEAPQISLRQPPAAMHLVNASKASSGMQKPSRASRKMATRFSLMPMVSVNSTRKRIEENEDFGPRNGREHREFAETESYGTTISPGLYAAYDITPKLSIQSGFSELKNNISISPKEIRAVKDRDDKIRYRLDCSAGSFFIDPKTGTTPTVGDSIRLNASDVSTRYASIPVQLIYRVGKGRLSFFGLAGAEMNILMNRNATTTFQNTMGAAFGTVRAEGLRSSTVNATIGAGVELGIGKRLSFTVMPQYRSALRSVNVNGPVKSYPKTVSVTSGLRVRF